VKSPAPAPALVLGGALLLLAIGVAYAHAAALTGMKAMWDGTPMYSFGYIVPFVSAYLVWARREALAHTVAKPAWLWGFATLALALVLLVGGHLGGILIAEQFAVVVSLTAVVLLVWGLDVLRLVWMALAYLLLIVPFWDAFTERLHLPFQQLSANLGVQMLHVVGVPAYREGTFLYLPNITLEVARACSGVNYLIAILALGVPLAYLYLSSNGRRLALVTSAIAVAALSNSLRVAMIGVLAYFEIGAPLHGPFHVLHGLFVSGIGYVVLFAGLRLLARGDRQRPAASPTVTPADRTAADGVAWRAAALAAVFLLVGVFPMRSVAAPVPAGRPLAALPDRLGEWSVEPMADPAETWWRGADDEVFKRYRSGSGVIVDVAVAYFASQSQGRELTSHYGASLHRGVQGEASPFTPSARGGGNIVQLNGKPGSRAGMFWYELDGEAMTSAYAVKAQTVWNAAFRQRTNGGVVVLLTPPAATPRSDAELAAIRDLAGRVHEALAPILWKRNSQAAARTSLQD
jgi:EpsI family protein